MYEIPLTQLLKQKKINQRTFDKVIIGKQYIERKYNLKAIKNKEWNELILKINSLCIPEQEKNFIKNNIYTQEMIKYRKSRIKQTIYNYESIKIIGRGAFGEVHVCRDKTTDEIVAIKKIKKESLYNKNQIIHIKNEQVFMSKVKSPWIVELKASFQDNDYLYLVMEFLQGGDLMNILIKKDILSEEEARFYIAEIILAVESIHNIDCIHRDIKPDNVLIDKSGHIKLTDFGLAKISDKIYENKLDKNENLNIEKENGKPTHNKNYSCVGTAYYVAPEVLNKKGYGPEIDWWSVGVIFYEMLVGYVPFCSKDTNEACYKVLYWRKFLKIPSHIRISKEAEDLIFKLINSPKNRLGKNGSKEIKEHPFFYGFNWDNIQKIKPPFIPFLRSEYDTSYFETFERIEPFYPPKNNNFKRKNIEYLDYSFRNDSLNDISLNDEYENAIKIIDEYKKKFNKSSKCEKHKKMNKNIKKRSNGGNMGFLKLYSSFQNEKYNISNSMNHNSMRQNLCLINISNNSSKVKINLKSNYNNTMTYRTQLTDHSSSGITKNKANIIKIEQKKTKNINCPRNESLNKILIPKGVNRSVNMNKKNNRAISPIYNNTNSNKSKNNINKKITINNINNNLMKSMIHYKSYCCNNYKNPKNNFGHFNIVASIHKKKRFYSNRNEKKINRNLKLNNLNSNTYSINLLYNNYIKGKNNINNQLEKSYNKINKNRNNLINLKTKTFRLSPRSKNNGFLKKFFFNRIIPSKSKKIISHNGVKSPIIYLNSSKTTYNKEYTINNNRNNITINSNKSINDKSGMTNIKRQSKVINIFKKSI